MCEGAQRSGLVGTKFSCVCRCLVTVLKVNKFVRRCAGVLEVYLGFFFCLQPCFSLLLIFKYFLRTSKYCY